MASRASADRPGFAVTVAKAASVRKRPQGTAKGPAPAGPLPIASHCHHGGSRHSAGKRARTHICTYHGGWRWLRLSARLCNSMRDYEGLAAL
jgi:hypothetical protein